MNGRWSLAVVLGLGFLTSACGDEAASSGCGSDDECARGQICESGSCATIECLGLRDCPGTGRTCLLDLKQCSAKECADVTDDGITKTCSERRPFCVEEGSYRHSCVDPSALSCTGAADCEALGSSFVCCSGTCSQSCSDAFVAPADAAVPDAGPDAEPDAAPTPATLCGPCNSDGDCTSLGEGAKCSAVGPEDTFCTTPCEEGEEACPTGFLCVPALGQCLPAIFECKGCLQTPCGEDEICNYNTGECEAPRDVCGGCLSDTDCMAGLKCGPLGNGNHCFAPCDGNTCDEALHSCQDGLCKPTNGQCDACGGVCTGATPACEPGYGCAQCGPGFPCPSDQVCDPSTHSCTADPNRPDCFGDIDCRDAVRPLCFGGECVECLQSSDCPAQHNCDPDGWRCEYSPCAGVECQTGSQCVEGRCTPGCDTDADCAMEGQACNGETGQCYYVDGSCDLGGGDGVCMPGSPCMPHLFAIEPYGLCGCKKVDPINFPLGPDLVACMPEQPACWHAEYFPGSGIVDEWGVCYSLF